MASEGVKSAVMPSVVKNFKCFACFGQELQSCVSAGSKCAKCVDEAWQIIYVDKSDDTDVRQRLKPSILHEV